MPKRNSEVCSTFFYMCVIFIGFKGLSYGEKIKQRTQALNIFLFVLEHEVYIEHYNAICQCAY